MHVFAYTAEHIHIVYMYTYVIYKYIYIYVSESRGRAADTRNGSFGISIEVSWQLALDLQPVSSPAALSQTPGRIQKVDPQFWTSIVKYSIV